MEIKNLSTRMLSKIAKSDEHGENSPYFDGWKAYDSDPFDPIRNPNGVIQMGLAENQLCFDLVQEWIERNPEASICSHEGLHAFKNIALFQDYHGLPHFRNAVARFMAKMRGGRVSFDPDRIVMGGGATGANEMLMFCLADPGDAFLIPSPYYPAFDRDLRWRTGVKLIPINCQSSNNFKITKEALEESYQNAKVKVKGLILSNPSNPLGTILDKETFKTLIEFINDKKIHLVCDEIYAATVFGGANYTSVSEIIQEMECDRNLIHIVYSLSKDMGFPGFRVGIIYSYNDNVVNCARKMSSFGLVSSQTQHFLASMLSDDDFMDKYLLESSRRLASRHSKFTNGLDKVGISCLASNAGLFCWMDLRHLLKEETFEGELGLWRVVINDVKLNVSPGSSFHCQEPGWFRVCFANMDDETMEIALRRIRKFVGTNEQENARVKMAKPWRKNLRLSFSSITYDHETRVSSPVIMSSPRSPLVRAHT
ncbi:1-aminocyclopropane-1-carboxylate synthase [Andrographis paniculata]|uniref:1-aminocyclopropane-1-carboxylate synthase n=1 Tax=Andrographis paniculata TaxID=175694 RepID=UPI0021E971C9|nr:1-aminocyclopropane-1-carboxylate synthase [Andrographis paniculata]